MNLAGGEGWDMRHQLREGGYLSQDPIWAIQVTAKTKSHSRNKMRCVCERNDVCGNDTDHNSGRGRMDVPQRTPTVQEV